MFSFVFATACTYCFHKGKDIVNVPVESYIRQKGQKRKLGLRERGNSYSLQMFSSRLSPRRVHSKDKNMRKKKI